MVVAFWGVVATGLINNQSIIVFNKAVRAEPVEA